MRQMRMVVPLALVLCLVLAAGVTYAAWGSCGGQATGGCKMMGPGGCKMMMKHKGNMEMVIMGPMSAQMIGGHRKMMMHDGDMMKDHQVGS